MNFLPPFYTLIPYEIARSAVFVEIDFCAFLQYDIEKKLRRKKVVGGKSVNEKRKRK